MNRIEEIRRSTGLNRRAFAERYKIPYRTIDDWENNRRTPPEWLIEILEKAVNYDKAYNC